MTTIVQASDLIILSLVSEEQSDLTALKLQKLLYYTQAWHLAFYNEQMFNGKFQAWIHGPVNREIYNKYKGSKYQYSTMTLEDVSDKAVHEKLSDRDRIHVANVLNSYAKYSPAQLEFMTHLEEPWLSARGGISPYVRCEKEIDELLMESYYKRRLAN